jgi:hypothetical protein
MVVVVALKGFSEERLARWEEEEKTFVLEVIRVLQHGAL